MQVMLRPPAQRFHPLMRPMYRRAGFAGLRGLGDGTCQVPQPGVPMVYPPCPASAPISSGAPAATYTDTGIAPAVYQAPSFVPVPACTQDTRPGGAAFSQACIAQLLQAQQQNMQLANNANFVVDYTNCVNSGLDPTVCASRTYGLTPAGGFTSDSGPQRAPVILDANGNPVGGVPVYTGPPLPGMGPGTGGRPTISFTNLTSGNPARLVVGDRWQIQISGAQPNAAVSVTGGKDGQSTTTPQGSTDSSGSRTYNGQVDSSAIGSWNEQWSVGGQVIGSVSFTVSPAGGPVPTGGGTGPGGSFTELLSKTVTLGGVTVPDWALAAGGLVGLFLLMRFMK